MSAPQGYSLVWSKYIAEVSSHADFFTHDQTGARILSVRNSDENKVFGISFRTPPRDSTGVAHILEHSVLCGSRKYPVKEPFVDLLKGSLQTFLNAMTYPDKTCYPVASQNVKDFYNLMDVYLDAVFFPRIPRHVFEQEGWHLDLPTPEAELAIKGVVYNEMKGVYSSPDAQLAELSQQSLFPDSTYGLDSGGNPRLIPRLTYEDFLDFHQKYYHPSNAWIFFYGDDDPHQRLVLLEEYLGQFQAQEADSHVLEQPSLDEPRIIRGCFEPMGDEEAVGMLTMNWLWPTKDDAEMVLACRIVDGLLTGMNASPLRQALIESGLGEDLTGAGVEHDLLQMYYSVGMKGVAPKNFTAVQELIRGTLVNIVEQGFPADLIEAAMNAVEFSLRENNTGSYPQGLLVMLRALGTWLYDQDPLTLVAFEAPLAALKKRLAQGEKVFEHIIQTHILDNAHHTIVLLEPEQGYALRVDEAEQALVRDLRQSVSQISDEQLVQRTEELRRIQEMPDAPEALALLPTLTREDIDPHVRITPTERQHWEQTTILLHDLPTNDICYADLALDLSAVPDRLLSLVPLFARGLTEMGTTQEDYISFSKRINAKTGGVYARTLLSQQEGSEQPVARLVIRSKAVSNRIGQMLAIIQDALLLPHFDQPERFYQMLLEERAGLEHAIVPSGHHFVGLRLRAGHNVADLLQERMSGLAYLFFLRDLTRRVEEDWGGVLADLQALHQAVINVHGAVLNLTMDEHLLSAHTSKFQDFLQLLPCAPGTREAWSMPGITGHEGLIIPAQVNYVGKICDVAQVGYAFHGASLVASKYLRTTWLWEQVRVLGGAYGAFCSYGRLSGLMSLGSYRDPNIVSTLKAFDGCGAFLETVNLDGGELVKAIIGTSGDLDPYQLPDAKGFSAMVHHLVGLSVATRQKIRDEVLATEERQVREFGSFLRLAADTGQVCVLGGGDALAQAQNQGIVLDEVLRIL
ncbi:MAG: insulinase family protein [Desulfomicrobium sp.]|nr:insulinase family protein [Desulfomicrobium sp.]